MKGHDKRTPGVDVGTNVPTLPTLIIKFVPVSSLMWWCVFNRKIMVGGEAADIIKQGHGTYIYINFFNGLG